MESSISSNEYLVKKEPITSSSSSSSGNLGVHRSNDPSKEITTNSSYTTSSSGDVGTMKRNVQNDLVKQEDDVTADEEDDDDDNQDGGLNAGESNNLDVEKSGGDKKRQKVTSSIKPSLIDADGETIRTGTIRRIMKLDRDVKMTGSEAVFLVSKATELFVGELVLKAYEKAKFESRKLIKYQDLSAVSEDEERLDFLTELLPDVSKLR